MRRTIIVDDSDAQQRLDSFITENISELNRSYAQQLIDSGSVTVNGKAKKPSYKLRPNDSITLEADLKSKAAQPAVSLPVIYEDEHVVVIDKPAGVLTHSKGSFNPEATVATFIAPKLQGLKGERAGIVHRLDRDTSGVMICAKDQATMAILQKQFSVRTVEKEYIAVVEGNLDPKQAVIDVPIERNPKRPQTFRAGSNGKPAQTTYTVLEEKNGYSVVQLAPRTGRTHQLRVHLAYLKHPIVGDRLYGGKPADRLYLHASKLDIRLPDGRRMTFTAPLPDEFSKLGGQA